MPSDAWVTQLTLRSFQSSTPICRGERDSARTLSSVTIYLHPNPGLAGSDIPAESSRALPSQSSNKQPIRANRVLPKPEDFLSYALVKTTTIWFLRAEENFSFTPASFLWLCCLTGHLDPMGEEKHGAQNPWILNCWYLIFPSELQRTGDTLQNTFFRQLRKAFEQGHIVSSHWTCQGRWQV